MSNGSLNMPSSGPISENHSSPIRIRPLIAFSTLQKCPWWLLGGLYFILSVPFVGHYPLPSGDEVIGNDPAAEWVLHGHIQSSLFGELPGFERGYFLQPPGQLLAVAGIYAVAGVSMTTTRIHALAWAALALAAWGGLAAAWTSSRRAGLLTAALIACIPLFGNSVAAARMDAQALALVAFALRLWLPAPGVVSQRPFAAGFLLGCAGLTHPIIVLWAAGMAAGVMASSRPRKLTLGWLVAGALVPFACWLIYAAEHLSEFSHQFLNHGRGKLGDFDFVTLAIGELRRTVTSFTQQPLLPLLYVAGAWSWWQRFRTNRDFQRETSVLAIVVIVGVTFGLEKSSGPHLLYHATLLSVGAGAMLDAMLQESAELSRWRRTVAAGSTILIMLIGAVRWAVPRAVAMGPQRAARDHQAFTREIARLIPPGSNVAGEPVAYYAVREAGGWLRLAVAPDARRHQFVISSARSPWLLSADFESIAVVGEALPPWYGRTFSPYEELYVVVARSRIPPAPTK
jgi:hypothetical protein